MIFTKPIGCKKSISFLKKINRPKKEGFFLPIGIEYTYHNRVGREEYRQERKAFEVKKSILEKTSSRFGFKVYAECGSLTEITSPVHKTKKSLLKFYNLATQVAKEHKLYSHSRKRGGGGAHINVSIPSSRIQPLFHEKFIFNLMVDVANRPYLNWIFNEPSDHHTAKCLWGSPSFRKFYDEKKYPTKTYFSWAMDKSYAIRVNNFSFEMRFFDMFRDRQDLEDVLNFVEAYLSYIYFLTTQEISLERDERIQPEITFPTNPFASGPTVRIKDLTFFREVAIQEFFDLLENIGLKKSTYERFIRKNFNVRVTDYEAHYLT